MIKLCWPLLLLLFLSCQKQVEEDIKGPRGGDFSIPTTRGIFQSQDHRGKVIFLFFGFTHCPQICPLTLSHLHRMVKDLPEEDKSKVEVLFVSVDVKRDTMEVLKERLSQYSSSFWAGTDSEEKLQKIMTQFGATYKLYPGKTPDDLIIDHTTQIFVINQNGVWVNSLKHDASPDELKVAYVRAAGMSPVYAKHRQNRVTPVLAQNPDCDLAKGPCELHGFEMSLSPLPVKAEQSYTIHVKAPVGSELIPEAVDFEGTETNMGFIRPALTTADKQNYSGSFYIPACDLPEMRWRAKLLLTSKDGPKSLFFYFKTLKIPVEPTPLPLKKSPKRSDAY